LIESGAIYSLVPTPLLERLGIRLLVGSEFRLANGTKIMRKKGGALFKYGDCVLLGVFTLEALGLSLDPLRRELRPLPMILAALPKEMGQ